MKPDLLLSLVRASEALHDAHIAAKDAGKDDLALEIRDAGRRVADAIGKISVLRPVLEPS